MCFPQQENKEKKKEKKKSKRTLKGVCDIDLMINRMIYASEVKIKLKTITNKHASASVHVDPSRTEPF